MMLKQMDINGILKMKTSTTALNEREASVKSINPVYSKTRVKLRLNGITMSLLRFSL